MKLYEIRNSENDVVYVGVTRSTLAARFRGHKFYAKTKTTPLYNAMRKYGFENFYIQLVSEFETEEEMLAAEIEKIKFYRDSGVKCYNVSNGGEAHFEVVDKPAWIEKLKNARKGRKPAQGMSHTDENKKLFSEYGKARWDKYGRYPDDIILLKFTEAKEKYGISKTHYYRLVKANDLN